MVEVIGMAVQAWIGYLAVTLWLDGAFNDTGGVI